MGNSEVGHLTIGSGRILFQDLMRVNKSIEDGSFFENPALVGAFEREARDVHLLGLVSYGGVHSHIDHLRALLELARRQGMEEKTWIHAFTDGRDVSPHLGGARPRRAAGRTRIATVSGRYYAMDRDQRWERTDKRSRHSSMAMGPAKQSDVVSGSRSEATTRESPTSSSSPVVIAGRPRLDSERLARSSSTSGPTARGS